MVSRARCPKCDAWLLIEPTATGTTVERCTVCTYFHVIRRYQPTGPLCVGCSVEMVRRRRGPPSFKCVNCGGRGHAKPGARRRLESPTPQRSA